MTYLAFGLGGPWDIAMICGVALLLFGGSKLGGFGKSLGEGIKEFKKATHEEEVPPAAPAPPVVVAQPAAPVATPSTPVASEEK